MPKEVRFSKAIIDSLKEGETEGATADQLKYILQKRTTELNKAGLKRLTGVNLSIYQQNFEDYFSIIKDLIDELEPSEETNIRVDLRKKKVTQKDATKKSS
jgi:xanthine dehydrogenase molybdopterin-binding subunit B